MDINAPMHIRRIEGMSSVSNNMGNLWADRSAFILLSLKSMLHYCFLCTTDATWRSQWISSRLDQTIYGAPIASHSCFIPYCSIPPFSPWVSPPVGLRPSGDDIRAITNGHLPLRSKLAISRWLLNFVAAYSSGRNRLVHRLTLSMLSCPR